MIGSFYFFEGANRIGIKEWLLERLNKNKPALDAEMYCLDLYESYQEVYIRELAFWTATNMVANAISKCEFKTFRDGKEIKGPSYWQWNYAPNHNQNSSAFLHKLIGSLYRRNEALIIERAGQLLVADSFGRTHNGVREDVFSEIQVEELNINGAFRASNVIFLQLNHKNMYKMLAGLNNAYAKMMDSAQKAYQWGAGRHGTLDISTMRSGDPDGKWMETFNTLMKDYVKPFMNSDNGVLPLFNGYTFEELGTSSSRTQQTTRDIRALIDDVYEITGKAFQIPAVLLKGEVQGTKDAIDNFLTFCVDPLADQLQEEITRKQYGYEKFIKGNYLKVDTATIKHFDLFSNAAGVDKLIASGAFSVNDIRIASGETPIDKDWADKHFITKNYSEIGQLTELGGTDGD